MGLGKSASVGQVIMWAGPISVITGVQEPVSGWLLCNGGALSKTDPKYASLQNVIGTTYGSDVNNFFLPDTQGKFLLGVLAGTYDLATTGGVETVTLTTANLPVHTHTTASFGLGDSGSNGHTHGTTTTGGQSANHSHSNLMDGKVIQQGNSGGTFNAYAYAGTSTEVSATYGDLGTEMTNHQHTYTPNTTGAHTHTVTMGNSGSGNAHNNMPPYASIHYLIKY